MKDWWRRRSNSERRVLLMGFIFLSALTCVQVWNSLAARREILEEKITAQEELYRWMRHTALEIETLRRQSHPIDSASVPSQSGRSLLALLDQSLRDSPLRTSAKSMEPQGEQVARVEFSQVAFNDLVEWTAQFHQQYSIQVTAATLERSSISGEVKAWLTFEKKR